ncbi:hypothetical protein EIN_083450 [Entamoeba invadens IP1]|uniref:hypothetical protein n=1 Tax=Entamoeba invadens IP1 TaxID=370355 RepID=UPI0002C3E810|nr:hypothetical protein EIN_083450 [Entamoeba invadens IP1]ELP85213.1 hypothetical protein EIN_083450 [Entamoeba invadens IP1]|eukprot:XP_004184559.1 hypothetical protein EIN_083450 [Entamoeba invadens IP1]
MWLIEVVSIFVLSLFGLGDNSQNRENESNEYRFDASSNHLDILSKLCAVRTAKNTTEIKVKLLSFDNTQFTLPKDTTIKSDKLVLANATIKLSDYLGGTSVRSLNSNITIIGRGLLQSDTTSSLTGGLLIMSDSAKVTAKQTNDLQSVDINMTDASSIQSQTQTVLSDCRALIFEYGSVRSEDTLLITNGTIITMEIGGYMTSSNFLKVVDENTIIHLRDNTSVNSNNFVVYNSAVLTFTDFAKLRVNNGVNVNSKGRITVNKAGVLKTGSFELKNNGVLSLITNNSQFSLKTNSFSCVNAEMNFGDFGSILTALTILNKCKITVKNRSVRNVPLMVAGYTTLFDFSLSYTESFDFAVFPTATLIDENKLPEGYHVLQNNALLRFGESKLFFCHLNETNDVYNAYVEPYCPCSGRNCFVTPLENLTHIVLGFETSSQMKYSKMDSDTAIEEKDVVEVNGVLCSLALVKLITIKINSYKIADVKVHNLEKTVLVISNNGFSFNGSQCSFGVFVNSSFSCLGPLTICYEGNYNITERKCEKCISEQCLKCDNSYEESCLRCKNGYILKDNICVEKPVGCLFTDGLSCLKCEDKYELSNGRCVIPEDSCHLKYNKECLICTQK